MCDACKHMQTWRIRACHSIRNEFNTWHLFCSRLNNKRTHAVAKQFYCPLMITWSNHKSLTKWSHDIAGVIRRIHSDCLLTCSSCWNLLPLVRGLCLLWLDHRHSSIILYRALSLWIVCCLPCMLVFCDDSLLWASFFMGLSSSSCPYINSSVLFEYPHAGSSCRGCVLRTLQKEMQKQQYIKKTIYIYMYI